MTILNPDNIVPLTIVLHNIALICYGVAAAVGFLRLFYNRLTLIAILPAIAGAITQIIQLLLRWQSSGHLPVMGLFETQHFLALWVVLALLYFQFRYSIGRLFPVGLLLATGALVFAGMGPKIIIPLTPAIDTPLFLLHVAASFAAYGLFAVGALVGFFTLSTKTSPDDITYSRVLDECLYLGFILFTGCMIAGSLWAYLSWGSYWTWKIKGLWSYILWFYYGGVIHVRNRNWWRGKPAGILAIVGFCLVLFTYLGLGLLFKTSHPLM